MAAKKKVEPVKDRRAIVLSLKGTVEYRDWLTRLADHCRTTSVNVMDLALVRYAESVGFKETAPKRTGERAS